MEAGTIKSNPRISLPQALFSPRSVALVGASGDQAKNTARPQRYLRKHGYAGKIFPINASRKEVLQEKAYPSVTEAPGAIDHAFIMVEDVEGVLEDCGAKGVPVASVFSDGFADVGAEGMARQVRLVARARELGVRLLGPNSMGMINLTGRVALTVNAVLEMDSPPAGATSIVSQSGTMLGTVLSRGAARGLGFSKLVSVGNEADLGVGELVELLAADPETRLILLFLETVRDAARLAAGARAAHAAGKPVVAYKLGRSRLGVRLARSHTGALAGEDAALDAYFRDCGILRVDMLETLIEIGPLLAGRWPPDHAGQLRRAPRVAVVTTTGGGAASVVDRLGTLGIETAAPGSDSPIVDLTMGPKSATYGAVVEELLDFPGCDAVLAVVGSSAQFHPQLAVDPILEVKPGTKRGAKPLAVFLTPHADKSLALLAEAGIAAFRTPEACADAFHAFFSWRTPRETNDASPMEWPKDIPARGKLTEAQALTLFAALGVPVVESAIARAPEYAHSLIYPVALKILSADVAHKSEVGGVILGIDSRQEFESKAKSLAGNGQPLLVQRMEAGLAEAIIGYRDDPVVGPLAMVGAGGILAELYNDVVLRLAPVDEAGALEMIGQVKGFAVLRGYRGLPPGDLKALARALAALSRLALCPGRPVREAEANPVIVKHDGVVAVDALAVMKEE
ncbi:MAG: acetate--CoA ligase family protein [Pseudomonadota bacterium]